MVNNGFTVQAEVVNCDITAQKEEELYVLELKKSFNITLVYQCLERQKIADYVFAAIPYPKKGKRGRALRNASMLCKKLGLGLLVVHMMTRNSMVELIRNPDKVGGRKNKRKQIRVLKEIENRSGNYNKGGKQGKIITAYREAAIHILLLLQEEVQSSAAKLIKLGAPKNTSTILNKNHYGWFHKMSRGLYTFDIDMEEVVKEYPDVVEYYQDFIKTMREEQNES